MDITPLAEQSPDAASYVVYAVAVLLLAAVTLFIKVVFFNKRPQKLGLVFILLAVPLYLTYYDDRFNQLLPKTNQLRMRPLAEPLKNYSPQADVSFNSDIAPALMVGFIVLVHLTVFQRVAVRERLQRIHNPIATFFAGSAAATMVGGTVVSTFHLGWQGAVGIGFGFALVYLGALALLAALVEVTVELSKLVTVWIKRKIFALATLITRAASWISSLGGRLVSRALIERIRAETAAQEGTFLQEQDDQDQRLVEAYVRDRERRRLARQKAMREKLGDTGDFLAVTPALVTPADASPAAVPPPAPAPAEESVAAPAYEPPTPPVPYEAPAPTDGTTPNTTPAESTQKQ
jgi:hypothetical protein